MMQRMRNRRPGRSGKAAEGKMLPLMAGAAVILILLIVILVRNNRLKEQRAVEASIQASEAESRSIEASIEAAAAESVAAEPKLTLQECDIPQISELIKSYFDLRLAGDAEGLYRLFGRDPETGPVDEEFSAKLDAQKSWVRSIDDVQVYLLPGRSDDEKLGIVTYKINFRRVNTKAPSIMYFYAVKDAEGNWKLGENLVKDIRDLVSDEFEEAGVQMLIDSNTRSLKEALEQDGDLALMYTSFMNGEIYSAYNLDPDREQQVDLFANPEDSILVEE